MKTGKQHSLLCVSAPKAVHGMLAKEVKGQARGARSRVVCKLIAVGLGPKYPKLLSDYKKLKGYDEE